MANRVTPITNIETLSGNISAQTYFDNNIGAAFTSLNDASLGYSNGVLSDTGSANNYIVAAAFGTPSALNNGMLVEFNPANSNTGASTLTFSPLAAAAIVRPDGTALIGGEIVAGVTTAVVCDGVKYRLASLPRVPVTSFLGTITTNQTVNCQNASSVSIHLGVNAATLTLTLTNLTPGVPVGVFVTAVGLSTTFFVVASNPAGGTYTSNFVQQGVTGVQNGFFLTLNKLMYAVGNTDVGGFFLMAITSA